MKYECVKCGYIGTTIHCSCCGAETTEVIGSMIELPTESWTEMLSVPSERESMSRVTEDIKQHEGKAQLSNLLHFPNALKEISKVRAYGQVKYPDPTSYKKIPNALLTDALMRHLFDEVEGNKDLESGCEHLAHLVVNAMMLLEKKLGAEECT